jgi:hypothetical protein
MKRGPAVASRVMTFVRTHRRVVVACVMVFVPLLTLIVAEGTAQVRLAGTLSDAAGRFLAALSPEQKARLNFTFDDNLERFNWHYIPRIRKGLALREMTPEQKTLALALLRTGLSASGYDTAQQIMRLEPVLGEREQTAGLPMVRDPENYYVVIFGTPSRERPWGWRVEGDHISVNFTIAGGRVQDDVISNTPLFFGAEPAEVQGGPMKGLRVLSGVEDKARALIDALDTSQRATAVLGTRLPVDILSGNSRAPDLGSQLNPMGLARQPEPLRPEGLPASGMTAQQKQLLRRLIDDYVLRMPEEVAARRARVLAGADFDRIHFAWIGATSAADAPPPLPGLGCSPRDTRWVCMPLGFPYYYRVQGPTFLVEYMNTTGNHSHSVWRDFQNGDFGEDLLRGHYASVPHEGVVPMNRFAFR